MNRIQRALIVAAEILETEGWTQGTSRDAEGHFCAIGAIDEAVVRNFHADWTLQSDAAQRFRKHLNISGIARWNDDPDRTADEVVTELRAAAEYEPSVSTHDE